MLKKSKWFPFHIFSSFVLSPKFFKVSKRSSFNFFDQSISKLPEPFPSTKNTFWVFRHLSVFFIKNDLDIFLKLWAFWALLNVRAQFFSGTILIFSKTAFWSMARKTISFICNLGCSRFCGKTFRVFVIAYRSTSFVSFSYCVFLVGVFEENPDSYSG